MYYSFSLFQFKIECKKKTNNNNVFPTMNLNDKQFEWKWKLFKKLQIVLERLTPIVLQKT